MFLNSAQLIKCISLCYHLALHSTWKILLAERFYSFMYWTGFKVFSLARLIGPGFDLCIRRSSLAHLAAEDVLQTKAEQTPECQLWRRERKPCSAIKRMKCPKFAVLSELSDLLALFIEFHLTIITINWVRAISMPWGTAKIHSWKTQPAAGGARNPSFQIDTAKVLAEGQGTTGHIKLQCEFNWMVQCTEMVQCAELDLICENQNYLYFCYYRIRQWNSLHWTLTIRKYLNSYSMGFPPLIQSEQNFWWLMKTIFYARN